MRLVRTFIDAAAFRGAAVSIGNFDGVHRGHQAMLGTLVDRARERGVPSLVMTFDPHPIQLLAPEKAPPSLMTLEQKADAMAPLGIDCLLGYPTREGLLKLSADEFFERVIRDHLGAAGLVEGPNFHFGNRRGGDVTLLRQLCERDGLFCEILQPVDFDGVMVSSSRIRESVAAGRIDEANHLLGRPYELRGRVVRGDARGRTLGFPTANLADVPTLLPPPGVYAGRCSVSRDGIEASHAAAVHIGGNPTFGIDESKIEVHLIGFEGDLYDQPLPVELLQRLRGVESFDSVDALTTQLQTDVTHAAEVAQQTPN